MSTKYSRVDIVDVKLNIKYGHLQLAFHHENILLVDAKSGEAVKIGELPKEGVLDES